MCPPPVLQSPKKPSTNRVKTVDSDLSSSDAVEAEALNICCDKQWSSFICVLALSSVINHKIISYYPDFGSIKHKLLYNQHIDPRPPLESSNSSPVINILFCREGPMTSGHEFIPNHFVPLVCATPVLKRKCSQSSTGVIPKKKKNSSADINVKTENKVQCKISFFLSAKSTNSKTFISSNLAGKANTSYPSSNNTANQQSNVLAVTSCTKH